VLQAAAIPAPAPPLFLCEAFHCRLSPQACVARQEAEFKVHGTGEVRRPLSMSMCDPERCAQGAEIRRGLKASGELDDLVADVRRRAKKFRYTPRKNKAAPWWQGLRSKAVPTPKQEETTMAACVDGCGATVRKDSKDGRCPTCRKKHLAESAPKCDCGCRLRSDSKDGKCHRCRNGTAAAPKKATPCCDRDHDKDGNCDRHPVAAKASVVPPPPRGCAEGWATVLQARIEKLSNDDLAQLLQFVRGLARERLRGADALRAAVEA
jgi:hypothetical protein